MAGKAVNIYSNTKAGWMMTANVYAKESLRLTDENKQLRSELKKERELNDRHEAEIRGLKTRLGAQSLKRSYLGSIEYSNAE
jgi:hypothetical protein